MKSLSLAAAGLVTLGLLAAARADAQNAPTVAQFATGSGSVPFGIASGPDGNLWFTDDSATAPAIGQITIAGAITRFPLPAGSVPGLIVTGPTKTDLWFTDANPSAPAVGHITLAGTIQEFPLSAGSLPRGITVGADGNLWFANASASAPGIGRITTGGTITPFPSSMIGQPFGITNGPDGKLWFTSPNAAIVGRITTSGAYDLTLTRPNFAGVSGIASTGPGGNIWVAANGANSEVALINTVGAVAEFPIAAQTSQAIKATRITLAPDQNLWFTGDNVSSINKVTQSGLMSFSTEGVPDGSSPNGIVAGSDGNLWFTSAGPVDGASFIGRVTLPSTTPSGATIVSSILPSSRSVAVGATATAFASIVNASTTVGVDSCAIQPTTPVPALFTFQATNPTTNTPTGTINTPIPIAPGIAQSFIIALTPYAATAADLGNVAFSFSCLNAAPAQTFEGVNTLTFSASTTPPPDVVAVSATTTNNGIVDIPANGLAVFAVATTNVGVSAPITVVPSLLTAGLPVSLGVCQTNASGACLAQPAPSLSVTIAAGAQPSFGVFVTATGNVPFLPAVNRAFLQFLDPSGVSRGATSVALRSSSAG